MDGISLHSHYYFNPFFPKGVLQFSEHLMLGVMFLFIVSYSCPNVDWDVFYRLCKSGIEAFSRMCCCVCGDQLKIEMWSMHANDDGSTDNILNFSGADLAVRKVEMVDIAFDEVCLQLTTQKTNRNWLHRTRMGLYCLEKWGVHNTYLRQLTKYRPLICSTSVVLQHWVCHRFAKAKEDGYLLLCILTKISSHSCWIAIMLIFGYEWITDREGIDLWCEQIPKRDYQAKLDPKLYKSKKTGWELLSYPKGAEYNVWLQLEAELYSTGRMFKRVLAPTSYDLIVGEDLQRKVAPSSHVVWA